MEFHPPEADIGFKGPRRTGTYPNFGIEPDIIGLNSTVYPNKGSTVGQS